MTSILCRFLSVIFQHSAHLSLSLDQCSFVFWYISIDTPFYTLYLYLTQEQNFLSAFIPDLSGYMKHVFVDLRVRISISRIPISFIITVGISHSFNTLGASISSHLQDIYQPLLLFYCCYCYINFP